MAAPGTASAGSPAPINTGGSSVFASRRPPRSTLSPYAKLSLSVNATTGSGIVVDDDVMTQLCAATVVVEAGCYIDCLVYI